MITDTFTRKDQALVNRDANALKAAKARKEHAKRIEKIESSIEALQHSITELKIKVEEIAKNDC